MGQDEGKVTKYRVVVHYLGHGEGGNATAWASEWQNDKDELLESLRTSLSEISEGMGSHLKLDTRDGGMVAIHAAMLQRSVVVVEQKQADSEDEQRSLDKLHRYEPRADRSSTDTEIRTASMWTAKDGEYVRLTDVRALLYA